MDVRVTTDPHLFRQTVFPFLQQDPVLHTLILTIVHTQTAIPTPEPSYSSPSTTRR
ncbi:hypothetical protein GCM10009804_59890 [Kribbella hippodromi]|uniref:Uncharacterized protein n=1 Tax=Kribbella hippodromi TaxID=434347 RepID=A0ABN2E510_9ACTN